MHKFGVVEKPEPVVDPRIVKEMGEYLGEFIKSGVFKNGAGLNPNFPRTRLVSKGGVITEEAPPISGRNELLASFAMIEVKSKAEALERAREVLKTAGDGELEVGRVTEPWDIGVAPKPTGPVSEKYLLLRMADARSEAGMASKLDVPGAEAVLASKNGRRLIFKDGKRTVIDGPFAESKELIGGFSILELPSLDVATQWAGPYARIIGPDIEIDVLQLP